MLIGFSDDTELHSKGTSQTPDIFVYGGYFISHDKLDHFQNRIVEIKEANGLSCHAPVKWNLKDSGLVKFYNPVRWLPHDAYNILWNCGDKIKLELLNLLVEFNAIIIVSARYDMRLKQLPQNELFGWAFENFNQRVGLMAQSIQSYSTTSSSIILVSDWPRHGVDKALMDAYIGGYYFGAGINTGQSYHSGALRNLRFSDSLLHGSTLHSGPLQIADLVVGASREFLSWALRGTRGQSAKNFFLPIVGQFYRNPTSGKINGNGFTLAKNALDIDQKIVELMALP